MCVRVCHARVQFAGRHLGLTFGAQQVPRTYTSIISLTSDATHPVDGFFKTMLLWSASSTAGGAASCATAGAAIHLEMSQSFGSRLWTCIRDDVVLNARAQNRFWKTSILAEGFVLERASKIKYICMIVPTIAICRLLCAISSSSSISDTFTNKVNAQTSGHFPKVQLAKR